MDQPSQVSESPLLREFLRTRRWTLGKVLKQENLSQELVALYMCSHACSVSDDETNAFAWKRSLNWLFRRAASHGLLRIGADVDKMMDFWHEVNLFWVVADKGLMVPDPYLMSSEQILSEVYEGISEALKDPKYQRYEAGCRRMSEAARR